MAKFSSKRRLSRVRLRKYCYPGIGIVEHVFELGSDVGKLGIATAATSQERSSSLLGSASLNGRRAGPLLEAKQTSEVDLLSISIASDAGLTN